ncbi:MAG: putative Fe-S protein YdhL (DUF1289 family) [Cellvibrionaceae bacterium]|jgi:predicted Fe-S protein YdhL (DUF1289 family)
MGNIKTPCIGVCSTSISDVVCRGCKRFAHEVIDWNGYSQEQRQLVVDRLDDFLQKIVGNIIDIFDEKKLLKQMQYQQIQFNEQLSSSRWVYELLRIGASQILNTEDFGFRLKPEWTRYSLEQIKQFLEQDFYTLSSAHHERYIATSS